MIDKEILTAFLIATLEQEAESSDTARFIDDLLIRIEFGEFDGDLEQEEWEGGEQP